MPKLRLPTFAILIGLIAAGCSGSADATTGSGGSSGSGGSAGTGGAGGGKGGSGGSSGAPGDSGACPKFEYTNYNPTASPTLKVDIQPILTLSCSLSSSCHQTGSTHHPHLGPSLFQLDGGKPSDSVLQLMLDELKKPSTEVAGRNVMVPGKPEDSWLMNKLEGNQSCGGFTCMGPDKCGVRMPDGTPLENAQIELIRAWIKKGAPM